ncbi:MAG: hypothetical protein R3A80_10240 [Bdellovibrionota bacterium]
MKVLFPWAIAVGALVWAPAHSEDLVKVGGVVSGFSGIKSDDTVDGALVIPTVSAEDLFQFNVDQFMGPSEKMTVGGLFSAEVPSNLYFPKQREWWGIIPVNFGKEQFSIMAEKGDSRELVCAWFKLPFDKMVEINNSGAPGTALLPLMTIHKHGFLAEKDWSTVKRIDMKVDKALGTKMNYSWDRAATTGTDMDGVFMFQATKTNRWAFVNLKGAPSKTGTIESMSGLENNFKVLFMRTHNTDKDVTSAEGHIRGATLQDKVTVTGVPAPLEAQIASSKITWTPIESPGWMTLVIQARETAAENVLFKIDNLFGGFFAAAEDSLQLWLDPKEGSTSPLNSNSLKDSDIILSFIGTTEAVPMPEDGQDNSAFLDVASEIRMKKLQ